MLVVNSKEKKRIILIVFYGYCTCMYVTVVNVTPEKSIHL